MNKRKRELEQNELADTIGSKLDAIRPYIPKIAMFSAVGVLAIIAVAFWLNTRKSVNESQWREYFVSSRFSDSRGWKTVAEIFPGTRVGNLALINAGDADFANGSNSIVRDRETYNNQLKQAAENFERVIESSGVDTFEKMRGTYALGYLYESLGRFDDAKEMYEAVVTAQPDSPEGEIAAKSLERVNDPGVMAIYTSFKEWVPAANEPAPGAAGADSVLPLRPDISMPTEMPQAPAGFDEAPEATLEESADDDEKSGDDGDVPANDTADENAETKKDGASSDKNESEDGLPR